MYLDAAIVQGDNLAAQTQSDARTVGLGRKERYKDAFTHFRQDTFAVVAYGETYLFGLKTSMYPDFRIRTIAAGFPGIFQQIQKDLFHLSSVGIPGSAVRRFVDKTYVRVA